MPCGNSAKLPLKAKRHFQMRHFLITATLFFLTSVHTSAQFYTIQRVSETETVDYEEHMVGVSNNIEGTTFITDTIVNSPQETCDDNLSIERRKELYFQLLFFDNEINQQMLELFRMKVEMKASRLRENYDNMAGAVSYGYEDVGNTGVSGQYAQSDQLTTESVLAEILRNNLAHPRVVLAQAVLETGWFKSSVCRNYNNLFGLTNPRTKEYYRFDTWQESVRAYYTKVQYRYKSGNYLRWLREIGYAEDPDYTAKLRVLLDGPLSKYKP